MTSFQNSVVAGLCELARSYGLDLTFEESVSHAVARFEYQGDERLVLVGDGELILEWDGEHYFEVPTDESHPKVLGFVELFRLCLAGCPIKEALVQVKRFGAPSS